MHHLPESERLVGVVFVAPFAEELNLSRHIVSQTARRLAEGGIGVLVLDLYGTGDSSGELGEARWEIWLDDVRLAVEWMRSAGYERIWLWGMRLGALLAAELASVEGLQLERCLLWQPVARGSVALSQFLRFRVANAILANEKEAESVGRLKQTLRSGVAVEVAGYLISPILAEAMESRSLDTVRPLVPVDWFEFISEPGRDISRPGVEVIERWRMAGVPVDIKLVQSDAFWVANSFFELAQCPAIVRATFDVATRHK